MKPDQFSEGSPAFYGFSALLPNLRKPVLATPGECFTMRKLARQNEPSKAWTMGLLVGIYGIRQKRDFY